MSVSVEDADSDVYQLDAGPLPADGRDHTLTVTLANQAVPTTGVPTTGVPPRRPNHRAPGPGARLLGARGPSTRCG